MPGEHGAEGGEGEEKQGGAALGQHEGAQGGQGLPPALGGQQGQFHHRPHQAGRQLGQQQEAQPRQVVGPEQGLPPHGEGVDGAGGAVVVQVAEGRHGRQHPEAGGQEQPELQKIRQLHCPTQQLILSPGDHLAPAQGVEIARHQEQRDAEDPDHPVQGPQGPVAGHGLAVDGGIKERCRGPHSPHLPIRK